MSKHVSQHVFLSFPMEVRSFVEEQTSKVKTTLKSHLLRFEKKMHCLSTVDSMISTYKVVQSLGSQNWEMRVSRSVKTFDSPG